MRWWAMIIGMLAGILLLAGCSEPPAPAAVDHFSVDISL